MTGGADNGLTLEGLAQRLEALERENAGLRDEVATFTGSDTGRDGVGGVLRTARAPRAENGTEDGGQAPEGRMSRRRLLSGAAAAAAGLAVAGSLTQRDIREAEAAQLGVTADVYEDPPISINDLDSVEYTIRLGRYGPVENAYWHVSIFPTKSTFPPGKLKVTSQWFEIDANGHNTLHYIVDNNTPSEFKNTYCTFVRKLVRIPARR